MHEIDDLCNMTTVFTLILPFEATGIFNTMAVGKIVMTASRIVMTITTIFLNTV